MTASDVAHLSVMWRDLHPDGLTFLRSWWNIYHGGSYHCLKTYDAILINLKILQFFRILVKYLSWLIVLLFESIIRCYLDQNWFLENFDFFKNLVKYLSWLIVLLFESLCWWAKKIPVVLEGAVWKVNWRWMSGKRLCWFINNHNS